MEFLWLSFTIVLIVVGSWWLVSVSRRHGRRFKKGVAIAGLSSLIIAFVSYFVFWIYVTQQANQGPGGPSEAVAAGAGMFFMQIASIAICFVSFIVITTIVAVILEIQRWYKKSNQESQAG